jgi:mannose-1-phosphate guanylyltransferase
MNNKNSYIVILAGGGGSRLWPKSRGSKPKQFLKLLSTKTLFQEAVEKISGFAPISHIYVVTGRKFAPEVAAEAPNLPKENILVEPFPKSTAAAAGLAAATIFKKDKEAIISTLASDHFIKEKPKFLKVLEISQKMAAYGDFLVTIGIRPSHPHTGLGYIQIGKMIEKIKGVGVFKVKDFKEKPSEDLAEKYFASGQYLWNANMNTYKAATLLSSIQIFAPKLSKILEKLILGIGRREFERQWKSLPADPIDTLILEEAKNVLVVHGSFTWEDVGDWASLHSLIAKKQGQNTNIGNKASYIGVDSYGCLVHPDGRLIATLGVSDLVIVDTEDVLLICSKSKAQEMKKLIQALKGKHERYL